MTGLSLHRVVALVRQDFRLLRSDVMPYVTGLITPLVLMTLLKPVFDHLAEDGSGGAVQAVPGLAVTYMFFLVGHIGVTMFREHGWNTWLRLRTSPASGVEVVLGRSVTPLVAAMMHLTVLMSIGSVVFGLTVRGSLVALALVGMSLSACLVAYGFALVAALRTVMRLNAVASLTAMLFGAIGGALIPIALVPDWLRPLSPLTPTYWAMRGMRSVIVDGGGVGDVLPSVLVLLGMAAVCVVVTGYRFKMSEAKVTWA